MDMEKYEKRNTHFLVGSFICVLLLCIAIFTAMTVYMRNESSEAMQNVGEIYMKETSNQLRRHFNSVIELRLSQVEGIITNNGQRPWGEISRALFLRGEYTE